MAHNSIKTHSNTSIENIVQQQKGGGILFPF